MGALEGMRKLLGVERQHPLERLEQAIASLLARGLVEEFRETADGRGFVLQWSRGNFGHRIMLDSRQRDLVASAVALPVGPFGGSEPADQILPMRQWLPVGADVPLGRIRKISHVELVEAIRQQGLVHPCLAWFAGCIAALAEGKRLKPETLSGMVLLGARKYLKTIPNSDRLNEKIGAATQTLLDMAIRERKAMRPADDDDTVLVLSTRAGNARAILDYLQETHPIETRRAVRELGLR